MSGVIRWQAPPPAYEGRGGKALQVVPHELIAVQLKRQPGEWAVVQESRTLSSLAWTISHGKYKPYRPAGSFEATARVVGEHHVIFARYVGEPS